MVNDHFDATMEHAKLVRMIKRLRAQVLGTWVVLAVTGGALLLTGARHKRTLSADTVEAMNFHVKDPRGRLTAVLGWRAMPGTDSPYPEAQREDVVVYETARASLRFRDDGDDMGPTMQLDSDAIAFIREAMRAGRLQAPAPDSEPSE